MADLKNPRLIYLKGFLFLLGAVLSSLGVLLEHPEWRTAVLLGAAIWCSARFYYFMFYVIEHYVDSNYKFAGIGSFIMYLLKK